jgi:type VII secretion integral membrane protein EccD
MTDLHTEPCRITVHGPGGRADVAVPQSVSVASLLPVLVRRMGAAGTRPGEPWVLQRLGDAPLDPAGTPESLDWRHGEEFVLRPAAEPLPEFDFDDVAEGMATMVSRQSGRWRPERNRGLFLGVAVGVLLVLGALLLRTGSSAIAIGGGLALAVTLLTGAAAAIVRSTDRMLILMLGMGGCGFAALTGALDSGGVVSVLQLRSVSVLSGGVALALSATAILGVRVTNPARLPVTPFGTLAAIGLLAALAQWFRLSIALTPAEVAGVLCSGLLVLLVFAPRLAIRLARIRGPQLPRGTEDLQQDTDPVEADEIKRRTAYADGYLTIAVVATAVTCVASFPFLLSNGLFGAILAALFAVIMALRARAYHGAWQRVALTVCGAVGCGLVVLSTIPPLGTSFQSIAILAILVVFGMVVGAMVRPPARRMLPVWSHVANIVESIGAIGVLPVLLALFGVYAHVAGLG